jgi:hypothetical protein
MEAVISEIHLEMKTINKQLILLVMQQESYWIPKTWKAPFNSFMKE